MYDRISKLPSLSPSKEVNTLFTELVLTCIPPSPIDLSKLGKGVQEMRTKLIQLCGQAEGLLESHYSDILANTYDNPIEHLNLFPYYSNYLQLSLLEYTLLARHLTSPPTRVAFVGSGPLPLSSLVLAARHMRGARFHNYDLDPSATERARRLARADPDLGARLAFHTADLFGLARELAGHDVVFLAALVGVDREEKLRAIEHLARHMAPGAHLVVRSAHGARAFLYPVVEPGDLKGFDVLSVYHPSDEVINSVFIARKLPHSGVGTEAVMRTCKCCEMMQGINHLGHGAMIEEMALEELPS
ncbi:nicotianamine synthase 3 [Cocos nucifera]|uniref:Nicotianamine synthase n=1 Tax=Cocos nucifera TaxID=13894 RepID=A0A8K0N0K7_COCNU|nr:nicotianamine synthase 3 [Cocos nucifera]